MQSSSTMRRMAVAMMALATVAGCAVEQDAEFRVTAQVQGPCERCGDNSPVIGRLGFHELSLRGLPNPHGYSIATQGGAAQLIQGSTSYSLRIISGYLKAAHLTLGRLMHDGVVGAYIPIERNGVQYELTIRAVHTRKYAVPPLWALETYTLGWREVGGQEVNPCALPVPESGLPPDPVDQRSEWHPDEAVVFEGDRIDPVTKTMSPSADDQWFNIACAGDALAKLLVTRNTVHSQPAGLPDAWAQRQAALKMTVADYCGTGETFTVEGQHVVWQGAGTSYARPPDVFEARWTENGASCVHAPRMLFPTTPDGATAFPDIWQSITNVCQPAACTDLDPLSYDGAYFVTAKPIE